MIAEDASGVDKYLLERTLNEGHRRSNATGTGSEPEGGRRSTTSMSVRESIIPFGITSLLSTRSTGGDLKAFDDAKERNLWIIFVFST